MKKWTKNTLAVCLLANMVLSSCGKASVPEESSAESAPASSQSSEVTEEPKEIDRSEKVKLTFFGSNPTSALVQTLGDVECYKKWAEHANVEIEWQHPAAGTSIAEQFNLLVAANTLPDLSTDVPQLPGGVPKAMKDKIIIPINDYMQYAPDYQAALEKYPECKAVSTLDDGSLPGFWQLDPDPRRTTYMGIMMRTDWLDKLGLAVPTTMDEWHDVLTAFRDKDPNGNGQKDEIPWTEASDNLLHAFMPAFGIYKDMYINQETGKVDYGPYNKTAFREFLETMHNWYEEGLIDQEFATNDGKLHIPACVK